MQIYVYQSCVKRALGFFLAFLKILMDIFDMKSKHFYLDWNAFIALLHHLWHVIIKCSS